MGFFFLRLKHARDEVKKKQADLKKTEQGYKKDTAAFDAIKKSMQSLEVLHTRFTRGFRSVRKRSDKQ